MPLKNIFIPAILLLMMSSCRTTSGGSGLKETKAVKFYDYEVMSVTKNEHIEDTYNVWIASPRYKAPDAFLNSDLLAQKLTSAKEGKLALLLLKKIIKTPADLKGKKIRLAFDPALVNDTQVLHEIHDAFLVQLIHGGKYAPKSADALTERAALAIVTKQIPRFDDESERHVYRVFKPMTGREAFTKLAVKVNEVSKFTYFIRDYKGQDRSNFYDDGGDGARYLELATVAEPHAVVWRFRFLPTLTPPFQNAIGATK